MGERAAAVDRDLRATYDRYYDGPSEWRRLGAIDKVRDIELVCEGHTFDDVVEVGAGEGSVLAGLDQVGFGHNLYGLEISQSGIAAIEERHLPRVRQVRRFDGYSIPYPDHRFDLAIATHVLEHVEHERMFLQELRRVSRYVFIEVPLENTLRVGRWIENDIGHINFYRQETLLALLRSVGLRPVRQRLFDTSFESMVFRLGLRRGLPRHLMRRLLLWSAPAVGRQLLTYHLAVLSVGP